LKPAEVVLNFPDDHHFCTLQYRASPSEEFISKPDGDVILLALKAEEGSLRLFADPQWPIKMQNNDLTYIDALLKDLALRSKLHPADLFRQLSSLEVGPIVTHKTGLVKRDRPYLEAYCSGFHPLASAGRQLTGLRD